MDVKALLGSGEARASSGHRRAKIGESFDPARNSLNFIRLVLAVTVVISHSLSLGGQRLVITAEDVLNSSPGLIAVFGFFGISGFLIARSAERNHFGRYLWQRFLRIFPGYWVCLLVTGFVIGVPTNGVRGREMQTSLASTFSLIADPRCRSAW